MGGWLSAVFRKVAAGWTKRCQQYRGLCGDDSWVLARYPLETHLEWCYLYSDHQIYMWKAGHLGNCSMIDYWLCEGWSVVWVTYSLLSWRWGNPRVLRLYVSVSYFSTTARGGNLTNLGSPTPMLTSSKEECHSQNILLYKGSFLTEAKVYPWVKMSQWANTNSKWNNMTKLLLSCLFILCNLRLF